jgi:hypothetical protein
VTSREHHGHDRLGVGGECLLRSGALISQVRDCRRHRGIVGVELVEASERARDVSEMSSKAEPASTSEGNPVTRTQPPVGSAIA